MVKDSRRVTEQPPAPKEDGGIAAGDRGDAPAAIPEQSTTQEQDASQQPCDPRCQDAIQREIDDLIAQQTMATFTEDMAGSSNYMADLTLWQLIVGGFGIAGLLATVVLSARATGAAVEANKIARRNAFTELRAYLHVERIHLSEHTNDKPAYIVVEIKNYGNTPAVNVRLKTYRGIIKRPASNFPIDDERFRFISSIAPNQSIYQTLYFREKTWLIIFGHLNLSTHDLHCYGAIKYEDVFEVAHQTEFRYWLPFVVDGTQEDDFVPCEDGNRIDRNQPDDEDKRNPRYRRFAAKLWPTGRSRISKNR